MKNTKKIYKARFFKAILFILGFLLFMELWTVFLVPNLPEGEMKGHIGIGLNESRKPTVFLNTCGLSINDIAIMKEHSKLTLQPGQEYQGLVQLPLEDSSIWKESPVSLPSDQATEQYQGWAMVATKSPGFLEDIGLVGAKTIHPSFFPGTFEEYINKLHISTIWLGDTFPSQEITVEEFQNCEDH